MELTKIKMEDALEALMDYRGKTPKKSEKGIATLSAKSVKNNYIDYSQCYYISKEEYNKFMVRGFPQKGDILLTTEAPMGLVAKLDKNDVAVAQRLLTLRGKKGILDNDFLLYFLQSKIGQSLLKARETGTTVTGIKQAEFRKIEIEIPDYKYQQKIASILSFLDEKIAVNNQINNNLEEQAKALFFRQFSNSSNVCVIGEYLSPKRGKNLLSKNALRGKVPVVAGGLEPATYHNTSNTLAPVITISASGANAGFVRLWHIPVWSSDSSYIDLSITPNVYFWYLLLKTRQKEIYDSQTGSAQPHIYPQHITGMKIEKLDEEKVKIFNKQVTPMFELIGQLKDENSVLTSLRDTLLPKLMSSELDVSEIDL